MSGTTDKIKGRVKEAVGALTDDKRLKKEGRWIRPADLSRSGYEKVVDKIKNVGSPKK
jgi:uncharacterized protein YjbJ (UPF0337 family)